MGAEADAVCGAAYCERSDQRSNTRNGYRRREWDTRAGAIGLAIPKLRQGSYFPDWLLERRRRAEAALVSVVATSYLLGVSSRRMEKLVERRRLPGQLGTARQSDCRALRGYLRMAADRCRDFGHGPQAAWHERRTGRIFVECD
jgi:putative transposase